MSVNKWIAKFQLISPAFELFSWLPISFVEQQNWPTLREYNALSSSIKKSICNQGGKSIIFKEQVANANPLDMGYEICIYKTGEVPTRLSNWHDFFNMLIWYSFPKIKSRLNALQYAEITKRMGSSKNRSATENYLTLLDENGVIVVSSNKALLEHIRGMEWKSLFWDQQECLNKEIKCFILGHSLHEKLLNPYIGMVGHSILLDVSPTFFDESLINQLETIEKAVVDINFSCLSPRDLFPIPILGFKGWHEATNSEEFYYNKNYFRRQRQK